MEETRKARIDQFFRCTAKRGEERKAVGLARWKERQEKNFTSCFSLANKLKQYFHSKPAAHLKAASKEIQKPCIQTQESNNLPSWSLKKPPFIVPGRIRHNDNHLLQAVPQVKNPHKKIISPKQPIKSSATQGATSKQLSSKTNSAAAVTKTLSGKDACPQCKGFVPPAGIKIPEHSSVKLEQETDQQNASSAKPFKVNFPSISKPNPWITVDRRTSVQKPFNSLLSSQESSAPQAAFFREDDPHLESEEEDSDSESKLLNDQSIRHSNEDQAVVKSPTETNVVNCSIKAEGQREQFTVTAVVHPVDHDSKNDSTSEIGSVLLPEVGEAPEKVEIALQLREQMDQKKAHLEGLCYLWRGILEEKDDVPQDDVGSILTVIGQTQQLQRERFQQYSTLILQFEKNTAEKTITRTDLEGFWEMISLQVTDVENKFLQLDSRRKAGWKNEENLESLGRKKRNPKSRTEKKKDAGVSENKSSGIRSHIASLRKKQMESKTSVIDNPVAFLSHQPSPVIVLSRLNVEANDFSRVKQTKEEGDTIQQPQSCQQVLLSTKAEGCTPNTDEPETGYHKYLLRERIKHKSATHVGFFSSPHQSNVPRLRTRTADCKLVDGSSLPSSSIARLPENSTPNNGKVETPKAVKVLQMDRKKHKSEINGGFFSSPHQTDSPRQRSRSTECVLDQPCSAVERWKMQTSSRFCESPKLFSPAVKQIKTRSGRVSQSPARFGQNETMSPYALRSSCSQYTKFQNENIEKSSENDGDHSSSKEENNNDVIRFPTMPSEQAST